MDHGRSIVIATTLLAAGAAFSATPPEGSYPEQPTAAAAQVRSAPRLLPMRLAITMPEGPARSAAKTDQSSYGTPDSKT